jgi:hypothetical protein
VEGWLLVRRHEVGATGGVAVIPVLVIVVLEDTSPGGRRRRAEHDRFRAGKEQLDRRSWLES